MKNLKVITGLSVILILSLLWTLRGEGPDMRQTEITNNVKPVVESDESIRATNNFPEKQLTEEEKLQIAKINYLKAQFGDKISNPYWQLKMIDQLMGMLKKEFPLNWESELVKLISESFPEYSEALIAKLYAHLEYIEWMGSLNSNLTFESVTDRRQAIWDKRLELFGDEAYEIWEAALKQDQFDAKMQILAQSTDSFEAKTNEYISNMKEVFGENVLEAGHKTQIMNHFLKLDNVQEDLRQMPVAQRKNQLREYRQQMGLDEDALTRWDQLDQKRDLMRATGDQYMKLRNQLSQTHEGDELKRQVSQLQKDVFGDVEAKVIANEEAAGYYRYNSLQVFGFN